MKIRTKNGQVDVKHLLKQMDQEEKRWHKMLDSGKYQGELRGIIVEQLDNLKKLRVKFQETQPDNDEHTYG